MFEELSHLLQVDFVSQPCDVDCAVLRIILLFWTSFKQNRDLKISKMLNIFLHVHLQLKKDFEHGLCYLPMSRSSPIGPVVQLNEGKK